MEKKKHFKYEVTLEEFREQGKKLYGDDFNKARFVCPICGNIATPEEYVALGATRDEAVYNCIGRYKEVEKGQKVPCNYTSGGLLKCNDKWIIDENGCRHGVFMFADEPPRTEDKEVVIEPRHNLKAPESNKWEDFEWPEWVPGEVKKQIIGFWGPSMGRGPKEWLNAFGGPPLGKVVTLPRIGGKGEATGRYVHAWNNIGRVVLEDGTFDYVSF